MPAATYSRKFFDETLLTSMSSAAAIVPLVLNITGAKSVVDLGCGTGSWLACFQENGVEEVLGVDNNSLINADMQIPRHCLVQHDLSESFDLERRFDLSSCLEVAEHLPGTSAPSIVANLTRLAPIVLFSAAIPHQGGTNHINEQWPEYWAALFEKHGYVPIDCIRDEIWMDDRVAYWYAQNLILYVDKNYLALRTDLVKLAAKTNTRLLTRVHPKTYVKNHRVANDSKTLFMRLVWNLIPRTLRLALVKPLAPLIWKQVSTNYSDD